MTFAKTLEGPKRNFNKLTIISLSTLLLLSGFFVSRAFAAGGGDPCADGIPDARFSISPGTKHVGESFEVTLNGSSSVACGSPITDYSWDFGDGTTASGQTITHNYAVGSFTPSLTITDGNGLTNTYTYYQPIINKADNQAPVISAPTVNVMQGGYVDIDIAANTIDPDGDSLTGGYYLPDAATPGGNVSTDKGIIVPNGSDGQFTYATTNANLYGTDSFTVAVDDGFGGVGTAVVTININRYITSVDDQAQTVQGQPVDINVFANDFTYDGRPFDIYWSWGSEDGQIRYQGNGVYTFIPNPGFYGTTTFEYGISDDPGNVSAHTDQAVVTVTVSPAPVNHAPIAGNDSKALLEDGSAIINVLSNDSDEDGDTISVTSVTDPTHGTTTVQPDGTVLYVPDANYYGSDSFSYTVADSKGATATAAVSLTVNSVNDGPTAYFTTFANRGGQYSFDASGSSDSDGVIVNYSWSFSDGTTDSGKNVSHKFKGNSPHSAILTVTDNSGATATYTVNL